MQFQSAVSSKQGSLIVGEMTSDQPHRSKTYNLNSVNSANNIVGRAFTHEIGDDDNVKEGANGGGSFAGILFNIKAYSISDGLGPSLSVSNHGVGYFITMGPVIVDLVSVLTGRIGEGIYYNDVTGEVASGTAVAGQTQIVGAEISSHSISAPGKAEITLTPGAAGTGGGPVTGGNANIAKHVITAGEAVSKVITLAGISSVFTTNLIITLYKISDDVVTINPSFIVSMVFGATDIVITLDPGFIINENDALVISEGVLA